jgi:hypothetical protein
LPAAPVQGDHLERAQTLTVRVFDREPVELADDLAMPARPHVGVDARFQRRQSHLAQACDFTVELSVGLDVGVGVATPQRQRLSQHVGRPSRIIDRASACTQVLECCGVNLRLCAIE